MFLEQYILDVIEGRRKTSCIEALLQAASHGFRTLVTLRNLAYDKHWLKSYCPGVPVVSVGNIVSGGVGKTPVVKKLAEALSRHKKVAILTRGFRSQVEKSGKSLRWQGEEASICGDEPYWLALELPQAAVWIGKKRTIAAQLAVQEGAEILILDDGMQHRQLARDADIVVMNSEDLWGKGHFLPRGYLRDLPKRLKEARMIVLTEVQEVLPIEQVEKEIRNYSNAPLVRMRIKAEASLKGKKVGIFCAIAKPERFITTVKNLGAEIQEEMLGLDHTTFSEKALRLFAEKSLMQGAELLICTEKDHVKLSKNLNLCLPVNALKTTLEVISGDIHWNHLIEEFIT